MTDLLSLLLAGRQHIKALDDQDHLRAAAEQVGALAAERGASHLVAAGPAAERVVGAALAMLSDRQRRMFVATGPVLVVDINLASGTVLAETARRLREQGAREVQGVVLHALDPAVGQMECGLDDLRILEPCSRTLTPSR